MKTYATVLSPNAVSTHEAKAWRFLEWGVALFSTWMVTGVYLDGWAHANALPDTFFTPWHGVIYSGFVGASLVLVGVALWTARHGTSLRQALPVGYRLSLLGASLFLVGGIADALWHTILGIEAATEAFYSPPHLVLATGGLLIVTGAFRAAWSRTHASLSSQVLMVLSLTLALCILTFFSSEFHPFDHPWAWSGFRPANTPIVPSYVGRPLPAELAAGGRAQDVAASLGISCIVFQTGLLMALMLLVIRRWGEQLPSGWLTFLFTLNALGMSIFHATYWTIPVAAIAGIAADVLYRWLRPTKERRLQVRLFATAVPVVLYSLYFLAMLFVGGTWWSLPLWFGALVLAGAIGWLVSYVMVPPPLPETTQETASS